MIFIICHPVTWIVVFHLYSILFLFFTTPLFLALNLRRSFFSMEAEIVQLTKGNKDRGIL
jgi:hypothetical protein